MVHIANTVAVRSLVRSIPQMPHPSAPLSEVRHRELYLLSSWARQYGVPLEQIAVERAGPSCDSGTASACGTGTGKADDEDRNHDDTVNDEMVH